MQIKLEGTLKIIFAQENISDKLSKQELVITVDENTEYPQDIIVQAINTKIDLIKNNAALRMGVKVAIKGDLRGRESKGRYYNQINLYDIQTN